MIESAFVIFKILGVLLLICKVMNMAGKASDTGDVVNLMGQTFTLRSGSHTVKR